MGSIWGDTVASFFPVADRWGLSGRWVLCEIQGPGAGLCSSSADVSTAQDLSVAGYSPIYERLKKNQRLVPRYTEPRASVSKTECKQFYCGKDLLVLTALCRTAKGKESTFPLLIKQGVFQTQTFTSSKRMAPFPSF